MSCWSREREKISPGRVLMMAWSCGSRSRRFPEKATFPMRNCSPSSIGIVRYRERLSGLIWMLGFPTFTFT